MENKNRLIELFVEAFNNLGCVEDTLRVHNIYARENGYEDVFENNDDFFDEMFSKPSDVARAMNFGTYSYDDSYVWFNGDGNLESASDINDMPICDEEDMAEWFIEEWNELSDMEEFKEFCERCQWGFDDEEK